MALLNPRYEDIGKEFVTQYYLLFDDPASRPNLIHLFNVSISHHKWKTIHFYFFLNTMQIIWDY